MFNKKDENNDGALRPETFSIGNYLKKSTDDTPTSVQTLTDEERILGMGADHAFWKTLEKHFQHEIEQIDLINERAMAQGATREQIGENTIIISLVKGVLKRIVGSVNDAKEAIDEQTRRDSAK